MNDGGQQGRFSSNGGGDPQAMGCSDLVGGLHDPRIPGGNNDFQGAVRRFADRQQGILVGDGGGNKRENFFVDRNVVHCHISGVYLRSSSPRHIFHAHQVQLDKHFAERLSSLFLERQRLRELLFFEQSLFDQKMPQLFSFRVACGKNHRHILLCS